MPDPEKNKNDWVLQIPKHHGFIEFKSHPMQVSRLKTDHRRLLSHKQDLGYLPVRLNVFHPFVLHLFYLIGLQEINGERLLISQLETAIINYKLEMALIPRCLFLLFLMTVEFYKRLAVPLAIYMIMLVCLLTHLSILSQQIPRHRPFFLKFLVNSSLA